MKKTLLSLPVIAIMLVGATFATDTMEPTQVNTTTTLWTEVNHVVNQNWQDSQLRKSDYKKAFHETYGYLRNYFSKIADKASREERKKVLLDAQDKLLSAKKQLISDVKQAIKNGEPLSDETIKNRIDSAFVQLHDAAMKYVNPEKMDQFESFVNGKKAFYYNLAQTAKAQHDKKEAMKYVYEQKK